MRGVAAPSDALVNEKVALFRTYLYTPGTLFVTPTVIDECAQIRDMDRRNLHESFLTVLIDERQLENEAGIDLRTKELSQYHDEPADCRILAEAEDAGFTALLSYDPKFLKRLSGVASGVVLTQPSEYWRRLAVPKGATPDKTPHPTNPLAAEAWWQW